MAETEITLPQLGETVEEALIIKWFKQPGEAVARGETLLEAETDKITVEVPALASGTLIEILASEGTTVKVGGAIARFLEEGADAPAPSAAATAIPSTTRNKTLQATPAPATPAAPPLQNKLRASPAARRAARDLGIDLQLLRESGSGPLGRISKADVLALQANKKEAAPSPASTAPISSAPASISYAEAVDQNPAGATYTLTRIERVSARLTQKSFQESPHFFVTLKVEMTDALRAQRGLPESSKVSLNDVLVKVTALALTRHPRLNASLADDGQSLILHQQVNIGVITATPDGVITSVVPDAVTASLRQIRQRVLEVRSRLQAGRAQASDVTGATFCISNMGMFGVTEFSAIILPPNVAILAVGALTEEVLVEDGRMRIGQTANLTVSADHRALDGVSVALFLNEIAGLLREPEGWIDGG